MIEPDWKCYEHFPDLSGAKMIAFDVETCDPNLLKKGPGTIRKDGYICGFSVATDDGFKGYYPIKHSSGNLPNPEKAIRWLKDVLLTDIPKIGANLQYDLEWVRSDFGMKVNGLKWDIQIADPLLDENYPTYRLDAIAQRWLGQPKMESELFIAGIELLKFKGKGENKKADVIKQVKACLYKLPAKWVGRYGEEDARLPIEIFKLQRKQLEEKGLWDIFGLESDIIDLLVEMRFKGVPVDIPLAEKTRDEMQSVFDDRIKELKNRVGFLPNVWAAEDLVKCCDNLKLPYLKTNKDNPSFTAAWLESQEHAIFKLILDARKYDRSGGVFIQKKIIEMAINGRIYPNFYQVKGEKFGTVSGRFSSSHPNAQQFPSRDEVLASKIRALLVADKGCQWACFDYKQQEPRVTVHYASLLNLRGAHEARDQYIKDPDTNYHQMVADWVGLDKKIAKTINLGIAYGMGPKKYSEMYNKTYDEAKELFNKYHARMPFIRELSDRCKNMVKHRGFIKTIRGRHCNFNLYGPPQWKQGVIPLRKDEAIKKWGYPINQYFTYRAMNRLIQGSGADMTKQAMVDCFRAGYIPNLTCHDELDFSDITEDKQIKEIKEIMVNAVKLEVPVGVDVEVGRSWGELNTF